MKEPDFNNSCLPQESRYLIEPIDPKPIVENGTSPTAIILAIAILIAVLIGSMPRDRESSLPIIGITLQSWLGRLLDRLSEIIIFD
ncbi:MAG: hypothetical protein F6K16_10715 [Symploca sp. SIO2B6]|nr:hypothetical protein [Symploca sp. SIO2B6]